MITNPKDQPVGDYLEKKVLPPAINLHGETQRMVDKSKALKTFADLSELDFEHFADSYAELLVAVEVLTSANRELEELLRVKISTKIINAITLANNLATLTELDPTLIAAVLNRVRRADIMEAALALVDVEHLGWLREALGEE